jgi:hypothetical protein
MTATAVGNELPGAGLADQGERIGHARPEGCAPEQAHKEPEVEVKNDVIVSRLHDVNVFPILAAVQLIWMTALGYELLHYVR